MTPEIILSTFIAFSSIPFLLSPELSISTNILMPKFYLVVNCDVAPSSKEKLDGIVYFHKLGSGYKFKLGQIHWHDDKFNYVCENNVVDGLWRPAIYECVPCKNLHDLKRYAHFGFPIKLQEMGENLE